MVAFGIGTAPALIVTGTAAARLQRITTHLRWQRIGGLGIIIMGLVTATAPALMTALHSGGHAAHMG